MKSKRVIQAQVQPVVMRIFVFKRRDGFVGIPEKQVETITFDDGVVQVNGYTVDHNFDSIIKLFGNRINA